MNLQEKELEQLVNEVESENIHTPPLFELYVTVFSLAIAIMFFSYPDMIVDDGGFYSNMLQIMSQTWWSLFFFAASMFKSIGLLFNLKWMRIIGLVLSVVIYFMLTFCYAMNFPTIGSVTFGVMAVFAVISIPFVKHTSIKIKKEN